MEIQVPEPQFYSREFFDRQVEGALRSGRAVAPIVCGLVHPASVVDVGCGRGAWLKAFQECGVQDLLGLDGDYVNRDALLIPSPQFRPADLTRPIQLDRNFDLALCLEVAEHLPPAAAPGLVRALIGLAPLIMFSAAVPLQGGTHHLNERWPEYWAGLFAAHHYRRVDALRGRLWRNPEVEWWYRQNLFLFAAPTALANRPELSAALAGADDLELVHRDLLGRHLSFRGVLRRLPQRIRRPWFSSPV